MDTTLASSTVYSWSLYDTLQQISFQNMTSQSTVPVFMLYRPTRASSPQFQVMPSGSTTRSIEQLAQLYAAFAEEDRELAEAGLADYADSLCREDEG